MATNLHLDDELVQEALKLGGHRTKREAVTQALVEYTRRLKQLELLELFGTIDFDAGYDYKAQRQRG